MKAKVLLLTLFFLLPLVGSGEVNRSTQQEEETIVLICTGKYATKYHKKVCRGLDNCKGDIKKVTLSWAKQEGYGPCGYCYGR
ncbi:MAG: hypothetical protein LBT24_04915 [Tannerella sp.]|nr:hypothetical protein [Tannerella sp.]